MRQVDTAPSPLLLRIGGLIRQAAIIYLLERVYELTRGIVPQQYTVALDHGLEVVSLERSLHIFDEWRLQRFVLDHHPWLLGPLALHKDAIVAFINNFYLYGHFIGTVVFLIWLFLFRRREFPFVRDLIFATTGMTLVIYVLFPMMPPRLMGAHMDLPHGYHFQDTIAQVLNYKLQQFQVGYNPYAAMPSLHFAWALILGATLVSIGRNPLLRVVGALYPFVMLITIVVSGNHLFLDAVGSVVVVSVATVVTSALHRRFPVMSSSLRELLAA